MLIVKGNFMTLAAKPKLVEEGEWLAHQGKHILRSPFTSRWLTRDSCRAVPPFGTDD